MPLPNPRPNETEDDFVSRCIKFVHDEGTDMEDEQVQAACYQKFKDAKEEKSMDRANFERRCFPLTEIRIMGGDNPMIEGYAAVFGKLSDDLGGFREKIAEGAFRKAIKRSDTRLLYNHDPNFVLARKSAGTLELKEDKKGLHVRAKPPSWANWITESIERGDVDKMSFGFWTEKDEWDHKNMIRTLVEVAELPDVSVVTFPAYNDTTVALRAIAMETIKDHKDKPLDRELYRLNERLMKRIGKTF